MRERECEQEITDSEDGTGNGSKGKQAIKNSSIQKKGKKGSVNIVYMLTWACLFLPLQCLFRFSPPTTLLFFRSVVDQIVCVDKMALKMAS